MRDKLIELTDKHFPKGISKERGEAMVLIAEIESLFKEEQRKLQVKHAAELSILDQEITKLKANRKKELLSILPEYKYHAVHEGLELDYKDGFNDCLVEIKRLIEDRYETKNI